MTQDWTNFLGPSDNAVSAETRLSRKLPPPLVWEFPKGSGYTSPAVSRAGSLLSHRVKDSENLMPAFGDRRGPWKFAYPTDFEDRYGYNNGPRSIRSSTAIGSIRRSAEGKLHCLQLATGELVSKRDLRDGFKVPQDFFGTASTPLIEAASVVDIGAPGGPTVVGIS